VPDLGGFAAANDLVGKSDLEVREAIGEAHLPLDCLNRSSHRASRARPLGGGRHRRAPRGRENREAVDNRLLGETVAIMQPNVV
jgi:hypothetical protein